MNDQGERGDQGQRGEVGQTGLTGAEGAAGTAGAEGHVGETGKTGQTGKTGAPGRSFLNFGKAQLAAFAIVVAAAGYALFGLQSTQKDIQTTADSAQVDSLRSCIRSNIGAAQRLSFEPEANPKLNPIIDCKVTIITGVTTAINKGEQAKYVAVVERGKFPIVADGVVVGERDSLLEGVNSIEEVGKP
jgi:hypothetical protein